MSDPFPERPPSDPQRDGIYRTILWVLVIDVVFGVLLTIAGQTVFNSPTLSRVGFGLALLGALLYAFFRWLGVREKKRQQGVPFEKNEPEA